VYNVDFFFRTVELPVRFVSANGRHIVRRMYVELFRTQMEQRFVVTATRTITITTTTTTTSTTTPSLKKPDY